ncbi:MAG: hypothetical protein ACRDZ1_18120 [Acidimicrobiia bacterium]
MSAQFDTEPSAQPVPVACPLCGTAASTEAARCGSCGYHLAGIGGRPGPFSRPALWWMAFGLAVVYVVTLLVVLAAR